MIQLLTSFACENCEGKSNAVKLESLPQINPSKMGLHTSNNYCQIGGFVECFHNSANGVFSMVVPNRNVPGSKHRAEWYLTQETIEDAVNSKWLLFKQHDEVWMPTIDRHGVKDTVLLIRKVVSMPPDIHFIHKPGYILILGEADIKKLHEFWKSIISP